MISEPELVGGIDLPALPAADVVEAGDDGPKPPRPPRPWLWALGGAVLASAVWAGGLYASERIGPDLGGYRVSRNLCQDAEFTALSAAVGKRSEGNAEIDEHPALDDSFCHFEIVQTEEVEYWVAVSYQLHKEVDPGPEFDAVARPPSVDGETIEPERVEGIGERAYLLVGQDSQGELDLMVLDGQAVVRVDISAERALDDETWAPEPVDVSALEAPVVEDVKALLARLKRPV
ncbi:hypothetical protein [Streptomyces sp. NPDC001970]